MQEFLSNFSFLFNRNCISLVPLNIKFNHNQISCTIMQLRASLLSYHHKVIAQSKQLDCPN